MESGGNIRFEIWHPDDLWYKSCTILVDTRCTSDDLAALSDRLGLPEGHRVEGVRVVGAMRVHHRPARLCYDRVSQADAEEMNTAPLAVGVNSKSSVSVSQSVATATTSTTSTTSSTVVQAEYLFYVPPTGDSDPDLIRLAEEGFYSSHRRTSKSTSSKSKGRSTTRST